MTDMSHYYKFSLGTQHLQMLYKYLTNINLNDIKHLQE